MFINDLSKMQYKNTNKGAADESLAWSQISRARVVIKEKKMSSSVFQPLSDRQGCAQLTQRT
jgi:hypothetical protein